MRPIPDFFAGAKIRTLEEAALKEHNKHPLELHRAEIDSQLYPTDRELAAYRVNGACLFVQASDKLQSNKITILSQ